MSQIKPPTTLLFLSFTILAISSTARGQDVYVNGDLVVSEEITSGGFTSYSGLFPGSITAHAATNQNLVLRGSESLGGGTTLQSLNDAASANQPLEFRASFAAFTVGGLNIGGTANPGAGNLLALGTLESSPPTGGRLGLYVNQRTGTGNYTNNGYSGNLNLIDVVDEGALGPGNFGVVLGIQNSLTSSTVRGNRNVMQSILMFNHASDTVANGNAVWPNYVAGYFGVGAGSHDNGTNTTTNSRGSFFGLNPDAVAFNGATNLTQLVGVEIDYEAQAGSSMRWKSGLIINQKGNDVVQGTYDNAISICRAGAVSATRGAKVGIEFGYGDGGGDPIATNGTLIKATSNFNPTVATGIDFCEYNITGNLIQGKYSSLGDHGGLFIGAGTSYTSTNVIAQGGQANIDIKIYPKGGGLIQVGNAASFTTGSHTTIAKWLKVKDDVGNVYYMPVYQ